MIRLFQAFWFVWRNGTDVIFRDPLTLLYNRQFLNEVGERTLEQARRYNRDCSIVMIDINGLKWINDTLGHREGDKTLRDLGEAITLKTHWRKSDFAFRWGGDEFLLILPATNRDGAMKLIEKIISILTKYGTSISYGVVSMGEDPVFFQKCLEEIVAEADRRMYEHKRQLKQD